MKNVPLIIIQRYKIELGLAITAIVMFGYFILPQIYKEGWGADPLRTMMFTLFGIVGLMGFSIAVRRHEEDRSRNEQINEDYKRREKDNKIQRMHACIQQLSNESPFAVFLGALHEIETIFEEIDKENQTLLLRSLCVFIQADRVWSPNDKTTPEKARATEEHEVQMYKVNFAFKTLKRLSDDRPIKTLKDNKIATNVKLTRMVFEGPEMSLLDENLTDCDFSETRFRNVTIRNCILNSKMSMLSEYFRDVEIDGCDLSNCFSPQTDVLSLLKERLKTEKYFYYRKNPPKNALSSPEDNEKFLKLIHRK